MTNFDGEDGSKVFEVICELLINNIKKCRGASTEVQNKLMELNAIITAFIAYKSISNLKFNSILSTRRYVASLISILFAAAEEQAISDGICTENLEIVDDYLDVPEMVVKSLKIYIPEKFNSSKTNSWSWLNKVPENVKKSLKLKIGAFSELNYNEEIWDWIISDKSKSMSVGDFYGVFSDQIMSLVATIMQSAVMNQKKMSDRPEKVIHTVLESFPRYSFPNDAILYQTSCVMMLLPALESVVEEIDWNSNDLATITIPAIFKDVSLHVEKKMLIPSIPLLKIVLRCINACKSQYSSESLEPHSGFQSLKSSARIVTQSLLGMCCKPSRTAKQSDALALILEIIRDNSIILLASRSGPSSTGGAEDGGVDDEEKEDDNSFSSPVESMEAPRLGSLKNINNADNPSRLNLQSFLSDTVKDIQTFVTYLLRSTCSVLLDSNPMISSLAIEIVGGVQNLQPALVKTIFSTVFFIPYNVAIATPEQVINGFGFLKCGPPYKEFKEWYTDCESVVYPLIDSTCKIVGKGLSERYVSPADAVVDMQNSVLEELKSKSKSTEVRRWHPLAHKHDLLVLERKAQLSSVNREWRRVGLDYIQEGNRYWSRLCKWHKHDRSPWHDHVKSLLEIVKNKKFKKNTPLLTYASENVRWKLDKTEGLARMRRRFRLNDKFYGRYGLEEKKEELRSPRRQQKRGSGMLANVDENSTTEDDGTITSLDRLAQQVASVSKRRPSSIMLQDLSDVVNAEVSKLSINSPVNEESLSKSEGGGVQDVSKLTVVTTKSGSEGVLLTSPLSMRSLNEEIPGTMRSTASSIIDDESSKVSKKNSAWGNHERILALLDEQDRPPISMYNISRVDGLLKYEGILVVCKSALYSIDNFNIVVDETNKTSNIVELPEMVEIKFTGMSEL